MEASIEILVLIHVLLWEIVWYPKTILTLSSIPLPTICPIINEAKRLLQSWKSPIKLSVDLLVLAGLQVFLTRQGGEKTTDIWNFQPVRLKRQWIYRWVRRPSRPTISRAVQAICPVEVILLTNHGP